MKQKIFFFLFVFAFNISFGQVQYDTVVKNGIDKPNLLANHHFGIFSGRINQNFKIRPPEKATLQFSYASANSFLPTLEMYIPKDEATRQQLKEKIWYDRNFFIDQETTPAIYSNIVIDAIFKSFLVDYSTKIGKNHEIGISLRSYLITDGKYPFSVFTNDAFIEWFHSNIAGGEDPFGRKYYGLNKVNVKYTDRNGRILELKENEFIFAGVELNHFYYPDFKALKNRNIFLNFGSHLAINTSKYNPSIDIGFSGNLIKEWKLKNKNEIRYSIGTAVLRKNSIDFDKNSVDLGNNNFLGSLEAMFEFTKYTRKKNYNSISLNYQIQSRFFQKKESDYYQLVGKWQEIHSGWQNGFEQLYKYQSAWTWMYTHTNKKYSFSLYLKEDLKLNNSPDIQTGLSFRIPIHN
jgi:hypothetical protein